MEKRKITPRKKGEILVADGPNGISYYSMNSVFFLSGMSRQQWSEVNQACYLSSRKRVAECPRHTICTSRGNTPHLCYTKEHSTCHMNKYSLQDR